MAKSALNLSVDPDLKQAVGVYVLQNPRAGRRNISELTETLLIKFLTHKGVKLPQRLLVKPGHSPKRRATRNLTNARVNSERVAA